MRKEIKYLVFWALLFCGILYTREAEAASVRINKANFPDALLREKLKYKDRNKDGKLSDKEIKKAQKIELKAEKKGKYGKLNLKGISRLTSLRELSVSGLVIKNREEMNQLKSLQKLDFYQHQDVGVFDLGGMGEHLTWEDGALKKIMWGKKKNLETIRVSNNKISGTFDFRKFTELTKVWCDHNKLTYIYGGVNLYTLRCEKNRLKKVDVRKAKHLWTLGCAGNKKARIYLYTTLDEGGVSASASAKISYVKK